MGRSQAGSIPRTSGKDDNGVAGSVVKMGHSRALRGDPTDKWQKMGARHFQDTHGNHGTTCRGCGAESDKKEHEPPTAMLHRPNAHRTDQPVGGSTAAAGLLDSELRGKGSGFLARMNLQFPERTCPRRLHRVPLQGAKRQRPVVKS